jgi:hypothetical protein
MMDVWLPGILTSQSRVPFLCKPRRFLILQLLNS